MHDIIPHGFTNLGALDKPVDENDIILGAAAKPVYTFPKVFRNKDAWDTPVEYQSKQPACGAHAGAKTKGLAIGARFSPRFTWGDIKTFDGWTIEQGTDIRSIFKSITKTGAVDFTQYGNDVDLSLTEYAQAPSEALRKLAAKYSGHGYGFITDKSFDGLKQFISDNGPTIVLVRLGNEWWTDKKSRSSWKEKDILPLRVPNPITSGHFIIAHSYDEKYIYFLNSFSEDWGRKGHGYFGAEYMPYVNDAGALFPLKFKKDLYFGMTDPDVRELQKYLNRKGYPVATSGAGSPGNETDYFGERTRMAVMGFQSRNGVKPVSGYFGPLTRAVVALNP